MSWGSTQENLTPHTKSTSFLVWFISFLVLARMERCLLEGKKWTDIKFIKQQFCKTLRSKRLLGMTQPTLSQGNACVQWNYLQRSNAGQFALNYKKLWSKSWKLKWNEGLERVWKASLLLRTPHLSRSWKASSPEPSDRWFSPEMF